MLLESYRLEILNSASSPGAMDVHCFAHLDQDVGEALPYLNGVLGGFEYIQKAAVARSAQIAAQNQL